jgi:hypothetical protein
MLTCVTYWFRLFRVASCSIAVIMATAFPVLCRNMHILRLDFGLVSVLARSVNLKSFVSYVSLAGI